MGSLPCREHQCSPAILHSCIQSSSKGNWEALRTDIVEPIRTSSKQKAEVLEQELSKHSSFG